MCVCVRGCVCSLTWLERTGSFPPTPPAPSDHTLRSKQQVLCGKPSSAPLDHFCNFSCEWYELPQPFQLWLCSHLQEFPWNAGNPSAPHKGPIQWRESRGGASAGLRTQKRKGQLLSAISENLDKNSHLVRT